MPVVSNLAPPITLNVTGTCEAANYSLIPKLYADTIDASTGQDTLLVSPYVASYRGVYAPIVDGCIWNGGGTPGSDAWGQMTRFPGQT